MKKDKETARAKFLAKDCIRDLTFEFGPASVSRYFRISERINSGKVLDVGCCRGILYLFLKDKDVEYIGLDKDEELAGIANKITKNRVVCEDIYTNKFKRNSFDVIVLCEVLEHVENPLQLLRECKGLLKEGGRVIGTAPNSTSLLSMIWGLLGREYGHFDHKQIFSVSELRNVVKLSGLRLLCLETFFFQVVPGFKRDFGFLRRIFPLLGKNIFFVVEKEVSK